MRTTIRWHGPALAGLALSLAMPGPVRAADETRARMREIFESMRVLLPLSTSAEDLGAPEHRGAVTRALETLAAQADALGQHAGAGDAGRRYLGRNLAEDARNALDRFREERYDSAAFLVQQATENCIACHTKLESRGDSPLAEQFVDQEALARLSPEERARIQIATRQFDAALATLEGILASPEIHAGAMLDPITDYLIVSIRVKGDLERPVPVLERFAKRPDLWVQLRRDVEQWIRDLRELRPLATAPPDLATARKLIQEAYAPTPFVSDRRGLVRYVVASSVLHRAIAAGGLSPAELGEAWYLLGICELQTADGFWVSQADVYLETAIRTAPKAPSAEQAYALLEAETIETYTGSSGAHVPRGLADHLAELRELVNAK
jgi:hypothetical protein